MILFPIKWQILEVYDLPSQVEGAEQPSAIDTRRDWVMHPAILGRIPLFLPNKRGKGLAEALHSRWGTVIFPDCTFNVPDEDVFLAVLNSGGIFRGSLKDLLMKMGRTYSKDAVRSVEESIDTLSSCSVKLNLNYKNIAVDYEGTLLKAVGDSKYCELTVDSAFVCNSTEERSRLHCRSIDLNIRKGLSATGKVIHRFLNSHSLKFSFPLNMVKEVVSPFSRNNNFRRELQQQLKILMDKQYLKKFAVDKGKLSYVRA